MRNANSLLYEKQQKYFQNANETVAESLKHNILFKHKPTFHLIIPKS